MRTIDFIEAAYREFPLRDQFVEVERQILRERTVAQVSFKSESLGLMLKLFVSEMEGEGHVYVGPLASPLGYREEGGWQLSWAIGNSLSEKPAYIGTPIEQLRDMDFFAATCEVQLRRELEWFARNVALIREHFTSVT